ncbi:hypothetical protein BgiMline_013501, partial [Biomphalaria glabrata]
RSGTGSQLKLSLYGMEASKSTSSREILSPLQGINTIYDHSSARLGFLKATK